MPTAPLPDAADAVAPSFIAGIILAFIAGIAAPLFIAGIAGTGMTPSLTDAADAAAACAAMAPGALLVTGAVPVEPTGAVERRPHLM